MSNKKKILILSKSELHHDPRILKQIKALKGTYHITTVGYTQSGVHGVDSDNDWYTRVITHTMVSKLWHVINLVLGLYTNIFWDQNNKDVYRRLEKETFDLIIANEINTLPLAAKLAREKCKIYADFHEYYISDKGKGWYNVISHGYNAWLINSYKSKVDHFTSVSPEINQIYKSVFGIDAELLDNACAYFDLKPTTVDHQRIKLVSHGASIRDRKLELMIDICDMLDDRFSLDLYLMDTDNSYINELKERANITSRTTIRPGIKFKDIQTTINQYDMGLYMIFPTNINNKLALPNKIFEFIQGRLAIAIGPSESMVTLVKEYDLGVVADSFDPQDLADKINALAVSDIDRYKKNTMIAARERNSDVNIKKIKRIVDSLVYE